MLCMSREQKQEVVIISRIHHVTVWLGRSAVWKMHRRGERMERVEVKMMSVHQLFINTLGDFLSCPLVLPSPLHEDPACACPE